MKDLSHKKLSEKQAAAVRDALAAEFQRRCTRNDRYSLRSFARSLDVSHSLLSLVLSGKRPASARLTELTIRNQISGPRTPTKLDTSKSQTFNPIAEQSFEAIASWTHYALLGLLDIPAFKVEVKEISKALNISLINARNVFEELRRGNFIAQVGKKWQQRQGNLTFANNVSLASTRSFIRGLLKKAEESMDQDPFSERNLTSITFAMDEASMPYAIEKIKAFRRELCEDLEKRGTKNRVYTLAVQLFPVSQKITKQRTKDH